MIKVVLIDDEPHIRKGLSTGINWAEYGCEICGEASDGKEGEKIIAEIHPDIIFTDIRMGDEDGFAMIANIKDIVPESKIIILTGYRDFEYAVEAVHLNVFDFLLKPTKPEDIHKTMRRCIHEIKLQRESESEYSLMQKDFEESLEMLKNEYLSEILRGMHTNAEEIKERMQLYRIKSRPYAVVLIEKDGDVKNKYSDSVYQNGMISFFREIFGEESTFSVVIDERRVAVIFYIDEGSSYSQFCDEMVDFQKSVKECFDFTITVAVSAVADNMEELQEKLYEAQAALQQKNYLGSNSFISYRDINFMFDDRDDRQMEELEERFLSAVKNGNTHMVENTAGQIADFAEKQEGGFRYHIKNWLTNILSAVVRIREEVIASYDSGQPDINMDEMQKMLNGCDEARDAVDFLKMAGVSVTEKIDKYNRKKINIKVTKAIEYINDHFRENISLSDISEIIGASTYYTSRIFKEETGKNIVEYLNETRVEKAKELLADLQFKIYEVADFVGIEDPHYFSKLFKKYVGCSAKEYRESLFGKEQ